VTAELLELTRQECLGLLGAAIIGRVIFTDEALPAAQPVTFVLDGEEVVFRTANGSKLAAAIRHAVIGFQVDEIDISARVGWSVLGVGEAYEVVHPGRLAELAGRHTDPWVIGHDAHTISVSLQIITGRRLAPGRSDRT
jgi:nitroimidazol reductase NimA-like FMN-containing flavoprotein (pyridoxamine 5'-phosphate oxidase superfamily)